MQIEFSTQNIIANGRNIVYSSYTNNQDESIFASDNSDNEVKLIAHRGDSYDAPENTMPAYIAAVEQGYNVAECDIRWTSDGEAVLLHDTSINRTASSKNGCYMILPRYCRYMALNELYDYDFGSKFSSKFKNTKITTLDELMEYASENNLELYIDLKEKAGFDEDKAKKITELAKKYNMEDNISWISTSTDYLKLIQKNIPNARLGYLYKGTISDKTIKELDSLKTEENEVFLDIKSSKVTKEGVEKLNSAGYDFEVWTVNSKAEAERLIKMGCKGITTDKLKNSDI